MNSAIRRYCNEGHDIVSAEDMHSALKERPVEGTTAAVCVIQEQNLSLKNKKIPNYSSFHSFQFTPAGLRVWKAYGVDVGKLISWDTIITQSQKATDITVDVPFFLMTTREIKERTVQEKEHVKYECPDLHCNEEFDSRAELDVHLSFIGHHKSSHLVKESLYDSLRRDWVQRFQALSLLAQPQSSRENADRETSSTTASSTTMGWALHKNRGSKPRFSPEVREYLTKTFEVGEATGRKEDPRQVSKDMRTACTKDGIRMFKRTEWLSKTQIQGFFSRMAKKRRQQHVQDVRNGSDSECEEDDDDTEEYAQNADEEQLRETSNAIVASIGVTHPIIFFVYDLCKMTSERKLVSFKVKMLRDICSYFELPYKYRDTKPVLIDKVSAMISECSCQN